MTDDQTPAGKTSPEEATEALQWLMEPAGTGEVKIRIELGEGAELAPEIREAVDALAKAIEDQEVQGYYNNLWTVSLLNSSFRADFVRVCSACGAGECGKRGPSLALGFGARPVVNPATFQNQNRFR